MKEGILISKLYYATANNDDGNIMVYGDLMYDYF